MASLIRHRGPDDEGFALFDRSTGRVRVYAGDDTSERVMKTDLPYAPKQPFCDPGKNDTVGLAHRRLSIIDLTAAGHQPMCDETQRYWISFNGEIYNFKRIRTELKKIGHRFVSHTDTEVFLKAYLEWGTACQNMFNGMWAALIWDNQQKTFWIFRDRFGVKPLFYLLHADFIAIASEIKCFLPIAALEPNDQEIYSYLADGPSESHDHTFFKNVYRFPAGHYGCVSAGQGDRRLQVNKYFELDPPNLDRTFTNAGLKRCADTYYAILEDAVRVRLFADVEVSCALSGGLDSSSITYLADTLRKSENNPIPITTVSNVYHDPAARSCDESYYINLLKQKIPVVSITKEPDSFDILKKNDKGLWHYENCYDDLPISNLNTFEICRRNNIKVNLDGQGADEILAGYQRYWNNYFFCQNLFSTDFWDSFRRSALPLKQKLMSAAKIRIRRDGRHLLYHKIKKRLDPEYRSRRFVSQTFSGEHLNITLHQNVLNSLKKLLRNVDFYSMFYSVESRQPYMDFRLISFLNKIPYTYKMHNGWTKYLARIAFRGKLPDEIVWRKDKMGWSQPLQMWIARDIGDAIMKTIRKDDYIKSIIGKLGVSEINALRGNSRLLFRVYNLSRQYHLFFERSPNAHF